VTVIVLGVCVGAFAVFGIFCAAVDLLWPTSPSEHELPWERGGGPLTAEERRALAARRELAAHESARDARLRQVRERAEREEREGEREAS